MRCIVLAAGVAKRYGFQKLLENVGHSVFVVPWLRKKVWALWGLGLEPWVVVGDDLRVQLAVVDCARIIKAEDAIKGNGYSLRTGIDALTSCVGYVMVIMGDHAYDLRVLVDVRTQFSKYGIQIVAASKELVKNRDIVSVRELSPYLFKGLLEARDVGLYIVKIPKSIEQITESDSAYVVLGSLLAVNTVSVRYYDDDWVVNVNTPEDFSAVKDGLRKGMYI